MSLSDFHLSATRRRALACLAAITLAAGTLVAQDRPSEGRLIDRVKTIESELADRAATAEDRENSLADLQNALENRLGRTITSPTGQQVQFPRYVGPASRQTEVITAVVNLHYYRDAHRVAQVLNRAVESFNGASVNIAERAAANAREAFEEARQERRAAEENARAAASLVREYERQLKDLRAEVAKARSEILFSRIRMQQLDQQEEKIDIQISQRLTVPRPAPGPGGVAAPSSGQPTGSARTNDGPEPPDDTAGRSELESRKAQIQRERLGHAARIDARQQALPEMQSTLEQLELEATRPDGALAELAREARRLAAVAQQMADAAELAKQRHFRLEVVAAKTDPDTYVAGKIDSVDPVTQVSISVIGEGILHLRGPRLGVTKLREMIHQIDQAVGQVKIGILTVQVNGERADRMENTVRRIDGNLSRGRFLTYVSGQYLRRAIVETATKAATVQPTLVSRSVEVDFSAPELEKLQRHQSYLESFFGDDFIKGLRDVDPDTPLLNPDHKLLALNSMDTVTLGEALFVVALAKSEWREEILQRFMDYVVCDLPEAEAQWIVTNEIHHHLDPRWWGNAEIGRKKIIEQANRKYHFQAILSFFERNVGPEGSDKLNPVQREVIKLVQGIRYERLLSQQRKLATQQFAILCASAQHSGNNRLNPAKWFLMEDEISDLEERHIDLLEGLRGRKAAMDNLIKRVVIAMEDDLNAQFYEPTMRRVRAAAREWDVELGKVERTTILTNNRAFGKVEPQATIEFDLPKRDVLIVEAMRAAGALTTDLGALLEDPSFLALAGMLSGSPAAGGLIGSASAVDVIPGTPRSAPGDASPLPAAKNPRFGSALEALVPDPQIYKFETGTGFEIKPVVQPDGHSVVFDFNYLYTTDLLEPVAADEKHLGRVKRHYINTEVQLGEFEWREVSTYEVALKATRNSRGVRLLEDIPGLGVLFRPLPQAEKSLQKNVIIGQAVIYPTVDDLLGLKSPQLADLNVGEQLRDDILQAETEIRRLQSEMHDSVIQAVNRSLGEPAAGDFTLCPEECAAPSGSIRQPARGGDQTETSVARPPSTSPLRLPIQREIEQVSKPQAAPRESSPPENSRPNPGARSRLRRPQNSPAPRATLLRKLFRQN